VCSRDIGGLRPLRRVELDDIGAVPWAWMTAPALWRIAPRSLVCGPSSTQDTEVEAGVALVRGDEGDRARARTALPSAARTLLSMDDRYYYRDLALAYVRGSCPELAEACDEDLLAAAEDRGLRLHRFKRNAELPRVCRVLSTLKGFAPLNLLDIGSGRGTFLWPLLDELPEIEVTAMDVDEHRVEGIAAVARGGIERLTAKLGDAHELPWPDAGFQAATVLEVLEHVEDPQRVANELIRVTRDVVVATVPSKPDDNPEHIRLFTRQTLERLFVDASARSVQIGQVRDHFVATIQP